MVEQALAAGHEVTTFSRRPVQIKNTAGKLQEIRGDAFDERAVADAVKGQEVVVSSLGTRPWRHTKICSVGTKNILLGMKKHGVKRLVVVSALGVGESRKTLAWFLKPAYLIIKRLMDDKEIMERVIRESDREWVIVRPPILTNGRMTGKYRLALDGSIRVGFISRADVAHFIATECLSGREYIRKVPSLCRPSPVHKLFGEFTNSDPRLV